MRLTFDLDPLSVPEGWDYAVNAVAAIVCALLATWVWRVKPAANSRWQRFQRRFLLIFLSFWTVGSLYGEYRIITQADRQEIAALIDGKHYAVASGPITRLVLQEKFWKSDPVPTFTVGGATFEYGIYSKNSKLKNQSEGGPLAENRPVTIWHHDGRILRLYVEE